MILLSITVLVGCRGEEVEGEVVTLTMNAKRQNDDLTINGTTNLGDGALLFYCIEEPFEDPDEVDWQNFYIREDVIKVKNGEYIVTVSDVPKIELKVSVAFQTILTTEIHQPDWIIEKYGINGENLTGDNVTGDFLKRIEVMKVIN